MHAPFLTRQTGFKANETPRTKISPKEALNRSCDPMYRKMHDVRALSAFALTDFHASSSFPAALRVSSIFEMEDTSQNKDGTKSPPLMSQLYHAAYGISTGEHCQSCRNLSQSGKKGQKIYQKKGNEKIRRRIR